MFPSGHFGQRFFNKRYFPRLDLVDLPPDPPPPSGGSWGGGGGMGGGPLARAPRHEWDEAERTILILARERGISVRPDGAIFVVRPTIVRVPGEEPITVKSDKPIKLSYK